VAGSVEVHGLISKRCVVSACCKAKQGLCALSGIPAGIAAIRWRDNCLRILRKRKAGEREQRERGIDNICYCFHLFISFHCSFLWCHGAMVRLYVTCTSKVLPPPKSITARKKTVCWPDGSGLSRIQ